MDIDCAKQEYDPSSGRYKRKWAPFLVLKRDYQCTLCCCNRPVITVDNVFGGVPRRIGHVKHLCSVCDLAFEVYMDGDERALYRIEGSCCQCGLYCRCPCGPCKEVLFDIIDVRNSTPVGQVKKVTRSIRM